MSETSKRILITGGAGFIGSHVVRHFVTKYPEYHIVNLDALTYAGNLENLKDIENASNYSFIKADIVDRLAIEKIFAAENITDVIHLAAESHVDRSIEDPTSFLKTNILGTVNLLLAAKEFWRQTDDRRPTTADQGISDSYNTHRFYHISTDEVYGSLSDTGYFTEKTAYDPRSPYSASKASSDHFVRAFYHTYGIPIIISNCSNNYGPFQFPEKLIPLIINNIIQQRPLPVYGKGENIRDWLWVGDHVSAMDTIFHKASPGESYNVGGNSEMKNIDMVTLLCDLVDAKLSNAPGTSRKLITFVKDRPGHDLRYAIDASLLKDKLGWTPSHSLEQGLSMTIDWYLSNKEWLDHASSGEYKVYYQKHYMKN
jgi:dTDP-glucose 4,6-dehydratase